MDSTSSLLGSGNQESKKRNRKQSLSTIEWARNIREAPSTTDHATSGQNVRPRRKSSISDDLFPDGGKEAWLTVLGGFIVCVYTMGYAFSFGDFQDYYHRKTLKSESNERIAWIGATQSFFLNVTGMASGPLFDVFGPHAILWPSAALLFLSAILSSISKEYWHFMLCQGVICGIGMGLALTTALAAICQHFGRKRALATGLALEGFPFGGLLFSSLFNYLSEDTRLGFSNSMLVNGVVIFTLSCTAPFLIHTRLTGSRRSLILWEIFQNPTFLLTVVGNFMIQIALTTPPSFLPSFAADMGYGEGFPIPILAIINICLIASLFVGGMLATQWGEYNVTTSFAFFTSFLIFCWLRVDSTQSLLLFCILYALFAGVLFTALNVAGSRIARDVSEIGMFVGLTNALAGCSALIGSPATGAIIDASGGTYRHAIVFNGVCMVLGAIAMLIARFVYAGLTPIA